jgi:hypothetical protein
VTPVRILAVALLLALAFAGFQSVRLADERTSHATTKTKHAEQRTEWEHATRVAVEDARTEEQRRYTALQGVIDEAEQKLARANADADAASDAGERLRKRLSELAGSCRIGPSHSSAPGAGQAADATGDMLADLQRRLDEAANGIAKFADSAHTAGIACQSSYGALTPAGSLRR